MMMMMMMSTRKTKTGQHKKSWFQQPNFLFPLFFSFKIFIGFYWPTDSGLEFRVFFKVVKRYRQHFRFVCLNEMSRNRRSRRKKTGINLMISIHINDDRWLWLWMMMMISITVLVGSGIVDSICVFVIFTAINRIIYFFVSWW